MTQANLVQTRYTPTADELYQWAHAASDAQSCTGSIGIEVLDKSQMAQLNLKFRGLDCPTNVLSFPCDDQLRVDFGILGDIALCAELINEQAAEYQVKSKDYWVRIVVHGALHLCGLDHLEKDQERIMLAQERKVLKKLKIDIEI